MKRRELQGLNLSVPVLGFGTMRLPQLEDGKTIDQEHVQKMVDVAMANGVNYFDTAYMYHGGKSEVSIGEALKKYNRKDYILVDKLPIWECETAEDMQKVFDTQLERCGEEYFDIYLLHSVAADNYGKSKKLGAFEFLKKMQAEGKIGVVGFSFHDSPALLQQVVDDYDWEICQLQLNYVDWIQQDAKQQYEILTKKGIPVIAMEPVRGGYLADLPGDGAKHLRAVNPDWTDAEWALRWVENNENVGVTLSGMSNLEQMQQNIATFSENYRPMKPEEVKVLDKVFEELMKVTTIPCTGCRYCMDCDFGVDIPHVFSLYNDYMNHKSNQTFDTAYLRVMPAENRADKCSACGLCSSVCPQHIDIPAELKKIHDTVMAFD